jgi:hypothetical protein
MSVFDPQTDLFISAIRRDERMREAEIARELAPSTSPPRRALAATMRHLAEHLDPAGQDDRREGLRV